VEILVFAFLKYANQIFQYFPVWLPLCINLFTKSCNPSLLSKNPKPLCRNAYFKVRKHLTNFANFWKVSLNFSLMFQHHKSLHFFFPNLSEKEDWGCMVTGQCGHWSSPLLSCSLPALHQIRPIPLFSPGYSRTGEGNNVAIRTLVQPHRGGK
jgi:hypothetical protein